MTLHTAGALVANPHAIGKAISYLSQRRNTVSESAVSNTAQWISWPSPTFCWTKFPKKVAKFETKFPKFSPKFAPKFALKFSPKCPVLSWQVEKSSPQISPDFPIKGFKFQIEFQTKFHQTFHNTHTHFCRLGSPKNARKTVAQHIPESVANNPKDPAVLKGLQDSELLLRSVFTTPPYLLRCVNPSNGEEHVCNSHQKFHKQTSAGLAALISWPSPTSGERAQWVPLGLLY